MFSRRPNVFELVLPKIDSAIAISPFESDWGPTDERLCYFENTLIGQLIDKTGNKQFFIRLITNLDQSRKYRWPTAEQFKEALLNYLSTAPDWRIRCERDCDQHPIESIGSDLSLLSDRLDQLMSFCRGELVLCPTFEAKA